jgi:hypothetical protein
MFKLNNNNNELLVVLLLVWNWNVLYNNNSIDYFSKFAVVLEIMNTHYTSQLNKETGAFVSKCHSLIFLTVHPLRLQQLYTEETFPKVWILVSYCIYFMEMMEDARIIKYVTTLF